MSFWATIWVVLMLFWLVFGGYMTWDPAKPGRLGTHLLPWACVAILGAVIFGGLDVGRIR